MKKYVSNINGFLTKSHWTRF